jgi:hypothetical protein
LDTFLLECLVSVCFPNQNCFDPVVANFLSTVSCPEELIQSGQTATGLKNLLTWLCSRFLSVFLSFRTTPLHFLHVQSPFDSAVASFLSVSFCPEGRALQIMLRIRSGFPAFALQLFLELTYHIELPFSQPAFLPQNLYVCVVANIFLPVPCPEGLIQFGAAAISLVSFPNTSLQMFSFGIPC